MAEPVNESARPRWQIGAAVAAWLLPGLGHLLLGERRRGVILMVTIAGLYLAGLLVGGLDVIDSREDSLWFAAQTIAGPTTIIVNYVHLGYLKPRAEARIHDADAGAAGLRDRLPYVRSIGRVNEMGTLFCAMAGLLNLLVIIDVIYRLDGHHVPPEPALRGRVVRRDGLSEGRGE